MPCECGHSESEHHADFGTCNEYPKCDCETFSHVEIDRGRTYRYFNPNADNYTGDPDDDIRKYCLQDYERARTLGDAWNFVGVRAEAEVQLTGDLCQMITSGGLWGIESDSGDYFKEVEAEQINELKAELHAIGFSKRAITAACRDIKRDVV